MAGEMNVFMLFGLWYLFIAYNYFMETLPYQKEEEKKKNYKANEDAAKSPRLIQQTPEYNTSPQSNQQVSEHNIPKEQNKHNNPPENAPSKQNSLPELNKSPESNRGDSAYNLNTMTPEQIHDKVEEIASGLGIDQDFSA